MRIAVLSEPINVLVDHSAENLNENWRHLAKLHIEEFKDEYELLAYSIHYELVDRPEHLFERIKLVTLLL